MYKTCLLCGNSGIWETLFCPTCDEKFENVLVEPIDIIKDIHEGEM